MRKICHYSGMSHSVSWFPTSCPSALFCIFQQPLTYSLSHTLPHPALVAWGCSDLQQFAVRCYEMLWVVVNCNQLQSIAIRCSELHSNVVSSVTVRSSRSATILNFCIWTAETNNSRMRIVLSLFALLLLGHQLLVAREMKTRNNQDVLPGVNPISLHLGQVPENEQVRQLAEEWRSHVAFFSRRILV